MELIRLEGADIARLPAFATSLSAGLLIGLERNRHTGAVCIGLIVAFALI